jgi:hypothetical protein
MYKEVLQAIAGIEIFPVVSLLLFVGVFGTILYWTSRVDRARLVKLAQMPLDETVPADNANDAGATPTAKGVAL